MVKYLILFLLFTWNSKAGEPAPTFRAMTLNGGSGPTFITQVAADSVGNTFWAGGFMGPTMAFGSLILTNSHPWTSEACLIKLGPSMDERWAKIGSGPSEQAITGLAVDADRNCYFAFLSWENSCTFDNVSYTSPSNRFSVIFKYSSAGNRIWHHQVDGLVVDGWTKSLALDGDNNVFFGGEQGGDYSFLRKLGPSGNTIWTRSEAGIRTGYSCNLVTDQANNCFLLSWFTNETVTVGGTILRNRGVQSYAVIKYDPAGNVIWARRGGGTGPDRDYGVDLAVDQSGDVYVSSVVGSTNFLFGTNVMEAAHRSWMLAKYSADGLPVWAKPIPASPGREFGGVSVDDNGVLVSASSYGNDGFLGKWTSNGDVVWTKKAKVETGSYDTMESMYWTSRLIPKDSHHYYVAGIPNVNGPEMTLGFDSFSVPSGTLFLAKLSLNPQLLITRNGDLLNLSWPTNEAGFFVESSGLTQESSEWTVLTNTPSMHNGRYAITNVSSGSNTFYRLRKTLP